MSDVQRSAAWLAGELASQSRRLSLIETRKPGLAYSSIEDGAIEEYTADGTFASSVGKQEDGSHVAFPATGPIPDTPVAASLQASPGMVEVRWSGKFLADAVSTLDFKHVAVHMSTTPEVDTSPTAQLATIRGELGDVATLVASPGTVYVRLVAWTAAGKASAPSPVASVLVPTPVNNEALQEDLTQMETTLGELGDDLVATKTRIDDEVMPAIDEAAASPITDSRITEGSLTVWPFQEGSVPQGALAPGSVGANDIADFSIVARKLNDSRHHIY
jgi:hypothetical protein